MTTEGTPADPGLDEEYVDDDGDDGDEAASPVAKVSSFIHVDPQSVERDLSMESMNLVCPKGCGIGMSPVGKVQQYFGRISFFCKSVQYGRFSRAP